MGLRTQAVAVVALLALAAQSAPAGADGLPGKPEDPYRYTPYDPAAPAFLTHDWSGFYIGGNLGWGYTSAESTHSAANALTVDLQIIDSENYTQSSSYVTGGVQAGLQRQWGRMVAGVEVGYTAVRFDTTELAPEVGGTTADLSRSIKVSDIFTLTGRLGYAYEQWLAYAKGGWANADVTASYNQASTGAVLTSASGRQNGWTAGVGVDYAIHPNLFVGVEYNYMSFPAGIVAPNVSAPGFAFQTGSTNVDTQSVVLRLNYRFGGRP
jgi:outer membrane immunogenic protein